MASPSPIATAVKMDALGLWKEAAAANWAVRARGTALPYFCSAMPIDDGGPVRVRFLMLEGWQTFHDFILFRMDPSIGFYLTPAEMPHFEVCFLRDGGAPRLFRHDPGYQPRELAEGDPRAELVSKILWQSYGVMMRLESDPKLVFAYAEDQAMFARVEKADGGWEDAPLALVQPRPHVEKVSLAKGEIKAAADLPFVREETWDCEVTLLTDVVTCETRPRTVYSFRAVEAKSARALFDSRAAMDPDGGLRRLWEEVPGTLLKQMLALKRVPGEVRVASKRLFRLLRPICVELPIKLSLHDRLETGSAS